MDLEATLAEIRALVAEVNGIREDFEGVIRHGSQGEARLAEIADEMAQKFEALDAWVCREGFAPAEWRGAGQEDHR